MATLRGMCTMDCFTPLCVCVCVCCTPAEHSQRPSVVVASAVTMDEAPPHRTSTAGPPQLTVEVPQSPDTYRVPRLSEGSGKGALPSARSLTSLTHAALSQSGRHMRARYGPVTTTLPVKHARALLHCYGLDN